MKRLRHLLALFVVSLCSWQSAWAKTTDVTVALANPGSLGVEILKYCDPITDVVSLTVTSGTFNDADWATLQDLTSLQTLDISGVSSEVLPARQFYAGYSDKRKNLVTVKLPSNLKEIGEWAFAYQSNLVNVYFPTTLTTLGLSAFQSCTALESINLPSLPSGIEAIPQSCFSCCENLQPFTIPEGVTSIGDYAFYYCYKFSSTIPSTITYLGSSAFWDADMSDIDVVIPEGCPVKGGVFRSTKIKSISFPVTYYRDEGSDYSCIYNCANLTDIYFKSPTVLEPNRSDYLYGCTNANLKIHVPAHLLEAYKLDSYFKDFSTQIVGDATDDFTGWWHIQKDMELSYNRMAGTPNIILYNYNLASPVNYDYSQKKGLSLQISGDAAQNFGNVITYGHSISGRYGYDDGKLARKTDWAKILNTCDNVTVTGTYEHKIQTYKGYWYFLSLPFNFKVGDIVTENGVKYAIRYYDGANRASTNAATGNWKNYAADDVIPAGTGFIIQTSETAWVTFKAQEDESRSYAFSNSEFVKSLAAHNTSETAHKGWNLVGNPWQCYYNIHKINYTAPISLWTGNTYEAYSLTDDDYALRPNEAFFVQKPDALEQITFPTDGRQLTDEITSQNGARRLSPEEQQRWLVDVQLSDGGQLTDKTRLVVNPAASLEYELTCDAGKMMSMNADVPQIYSLDQGDNQYAINERPMGKGTLRLGIVIRKAGQYTISAIRNTLGQVLLNDSETGITTDLQLNGYVFDAKQGTDENRFTLTFSGSKATGISSVQADDEAAEEIFTLDGRRAAQTGKGIYVVRKGQKTQKMIVK